MRERDEHRVRTRVVVDVIAGTSAGGINGIYLAKALAHNRSQDELRDVWIERGDISQLLRGPAAASRGRHAPWLLLVASARSPLNGDAMSRWLYEALEAMDAGALRPPELDDAHARRPPARAVRDHHGLLRLRPRARDQRPAAGPRPGAPARPAVPAGRRRRRLHAAPDNGWLAFSARATSSFPGAFPPVSLREFQATVRPAGGLPRPERFFRLYELSQASRTSALRRRRRSRQPALRPRDPAIRERPAGVQVDRRLLYLEPDPAAPPRLPMNGRPGPIATVLGSVAGIPRQQPILDEILEVDAPQRAGPPDARHHRDGVRRHHGAREPGDRHRPRAVWWSRRAERIWRAGASSSTTRRRRPPASDTRRTSGPRSALSWTATREPSASSPITPRTATRPRSCAPSCGPGPASACSPSATDGSRRTTVMSRSCAGSTSTTAPDGCGS